MEKNDKNLTPPSPLDRGEHDRAETSATPSPVKGRAGEGLKHLPYDRWLTAHARENRKNPTPAETVLWNKVLRHRQFADFKFHRQKPIGPYIVDFYCAEIKLVIEIDGDSHAERISYDRERTAFLSEFGITVVRYNNRDVLGNLEGVFDNLCKRTVQRP